MSKGNRLNEPSGPQCGSVSAVMIVCIMLGMSGGSLASAADPQQVPMKPPRVLSGMEAVIYKDLVTLKGELQRLDEALARPGSNPQAVVAAGVPRLMGTWRALGARVAVLKAQASKAKDTPGLNRAMASERQMLPLQQAITSLPSDVDGNDVALAKKKGRGKVKNIEFIVVKMEDVMISSVRP